MKYIITIIINLLFLTLCFSSIASNITTNYIISQNLGTIRSNYDGYVGMKIVVGTNPIIVTDLGRMMAGGNKNVHTIKIVKASDGTDVVGGSVSVNMNGGTAGQFIYASLASPVTLAAAAAYYVVSQETSGGDNWYDINTTVTTTTVATVSSGAYLSASGIWYFNGSTGQTYVPVNFAYVISISPPPPVMGPPGPSVTLTWNASCSPSTMGYNLYYGGGVSPTQTNIVSSFVDDCGVSHPAITNLYYGNYTNFINVVGQTNNFCVVSNLSPGVTYFFSVTIQNSSGIESDKSAEVIYTIPPVATITYVGNKLEWWTNMAYINNQSFYLTSFTNPPSIQFFYRSFLIMTNRFGSPGVIDLKSRLEWYTNLMNINNQIFNLASFTNTPYFYRSSLILTNRSF